MMSKHRDKVSKQQFLLLLIIAGALFVMTFLLFVIRYIPDRGGTAVDKADPVRHHAKDLLFEVPLFADPVRDGYCHLVLFWLGNRLFSGRFLR